LRAQVRGRAAAPKSRQRSDHRSFERDDGKLRIINMQKSMMATKYPNKAVSMALSYKNKTESSDASDRSSAMVAATLQLAVARQAAAISRRLSES
jgi:hypothetical protein